MTPECSVDADKTAYEIAMQRNNVQLMRTIERFARISAFMQVRMMTVGLMGLIPRSKFLEKWVVLVPREPPLDAAVNLRVIHSQLLVFNDHLSHQPVAKIWVDGATMARVGDTAGERYLLKLHRHHPNPNNFRVEIDENGLLCISFKESSRPDHFGQVARLSHIVNAVTQAASAAHNPHTRPPPEQPAANAVQSAGALAPLSAVRPLAQSASPQGTSSGQHSAPQHVLASAPQVVEHCRSDEEVAMDLQQQEMVAARMSHADLVQQLEARKTPVPPPSHNPNPPLSV
jgi:hypothetical protein